MARFQHLLKRPIAQSVMGLSAAVIIGLIIALGGWYFRGGRIYSVQTNSMMPTFKAGDGVITKAIAASQLQPGTVVAYRDRQNPALIISHRLTALDASTGTIITKGDHNHLADAPISAGQVIGQVTAIAPGWGRAMKLLMSPVGLVACIYGPAIAVVLLELRKLYQLQYRVHYILQRR